MKYEYEYKSYDQAEPDDIGRGDYVDDDMYLMKSIEFYEEDDNDLSSMVQEMACIHERVMLMNL